METHHILGSNSTVPDGGSPQANMSVYDDCVKSDLHPPSAGIRKADSKQEYSGKLWKKKKKERKHTGQKIWTVCSKKENKQKIKKQQQKKENKTEKCPLCI